MDTPSNISEMDKETGQISPKLVKSTVIIGCVTFLLGVAVTFGAVYLYKDKFFASRMAMAYRFSLGRLPTCVPEIAKNTDDKNLMVYILKYNETMMARLEVFKGSLSNVKYKALVATEISREKKEQSRMKSAYKSQYGKEYDSRTATTTLMKTIGIPGDITKEKGLSEVDRMSLFRGQLEYLEREYYTFALLSNNNTIVENATSFFAYKKDFVQKLMEIKQK